MFMILLIIAFSVANCLEPVADDKIDDEIKKAITKYLDKIPDIEPQYVMHEGLSKVISRYFKGKVSTFPLYKISLKIDRKPVKIPWSLADPAQLRNPVFTSLKEKAKKGRTYHYVSTKKSNKTT